MLQQARERRRCNIGVWPRWCVAKRRCNAGGWPWRSATSRGPRVVLGPRTPAPGRWPGSGCRRMPGSVARALEGAGRVP